MRRSFVSIAAVTLVTAYFSATYFHPDEHFQVLEFMSYKLGKTAAADLPWEFQARIRPWMQPFLYFLIAEPLIAAGIRDLFDVVFGLRLATGLVSLVALAAFTRSMLVEFESDEEKLYFAGAISFFGFLPYLFVRTSSETLSAAFFTLGLALVVNRAQPPSLRRFAAAGYLCGMAFECRFQSAVLIVGLTLWLVMIARARVSALATFALAGFGPVLFALFVDRWGYGVWSFPPWTYLRVNLVDNLAAQRFGTDPFYSYIYYLPANIFLPLVVLLFISMFIACVRNPRHVVTWVTLPFFVVHSFIPHKEERFLFPLSILATSYPVLAFAPSHTRLLPAIAGLWRYRRSTVVKCVATASVAAMLFLAIYPLGFEAHLPMASYLSRHFAGTAYTFDREPFRSYPMYRPDRFSSIRLQNVAELQTMLSRGPVYLLSETPTLPKGEIAKGVKATVLYSELPFASNPRIAALGTHLMQLDRGADHKIDDLKLPQFTWLTLFRVDRSR